MRWALLLVPSLILAPAAGAAPPAVTAQASPASGAAPLAITLTASGDAATYHWTLGDGTSADGAVVQHVYAAGAYTATVTAVGAGGETAQARVRVASVGLSLTAPRAARFGQRVVLRGRIVPARAARRVALYRGGRWIASAATGVAGGFRLPIRIAAPGPFEVRSAGARSNPASILVRPALEAALRGKGVLGEPLVLVARLQPSTAGPLRVRVWRDGRQTLVRTYGGTARLRLDTSRANAFRLRISSLPRTGFGAVGRVLRAQVVLPQLAPGSSGPAVAQLASRLADLHYASPRGASFDSEVLDGVYAFQKVQGLPRTGVVDRRTWARLTNPRLPHPQFSSPGDHVEIDRGHQVLYVVRGAGIALIVPVSTAGIPGAYTPSGRFAIYRKVTGYDPSPLGTLYDPMYFTGGYAIHGNPSVPPYPASHGCVRVPMWVAPLLYASNPYGEIVYVY